MEPRELAGLGLVRGLTIQDLEFLDALPRTETGKLQRFKLRERRDREASL
jgi:acyl-coenzyme A synthetase/AMP-(fatty) acid ligase